MVTTCHILFDRLPPPNELTSLKDHWFACAQKSDLPDPCCSEPPWALSYHWTHGADRPVLFLCEHGNVVCFAESILEEGTYLVPLESSWMYDRPILGSDPLPLFFRAIDQIEEHYKGKKFPFIVLGGMWPHHPFANELLTHVSHDFSFVGIRQTVQCAASLEGGMDTFLRNRSANFRQKLKKACRKAKEAGITFERIQPRTQAEAQALYPRMLALEAKSWKGRNQDGLLHPHSTHFYELLLAELALYGKARVIFAKQEERDIGLIFGCLSNGIYRGQQFSYDCDLAAYSIGNVLQYEQILWLTEEGCQRYDMGPITGPRMEYKRHWTELCFLLECWLLIRTPQRFVVPLRGQCS